MLGVLYAYSNSYIEKSVATRYTFFYVVHSAACHVKVQCFKLTAFSASAKAVSFGRLKNPLVEIQELYRAWVLFN